MDYVKPVDVVKTMTAAGAAKANLPWRDVTTVVCRLHAWKVDLESGALQKPQDGHACVKTFRTEVVDGIVLLEVTVQKPAISEFPVFQADAIANEAWQPQVAI